MTDAFLDDEASVEDSQPREVIDVASPTITYRIATGARDILIGAVVYTAIPAARGEIGMNAAGNEKELELILPIDHPFVRRYTQQGNPPRKVTVSVWRKQVRSGLVERIWYGDITSMGAEDREGGRVAKFRVPSRMGQALLRVVPSIVIGKSCPHILYDSLCQVDRTAFKITPAMISLNGRDVRVDMGATHGGDWAVGGELVHVASGERMTIRTQTDVGGGSTVADLTLQMPVVGMQLGDAIEIYAGCLHDIATCHTKFNNRHRHGGFPRLPKKPVFSEAAFSPTGDGLAEA